MTEQITPFTFENPERHSDAMRELMERCWFVADDGQKFSGLHLNRDFSGKPLIRLNGMFNASNAAEQKYTAYQDAAANPDRPVVMLDMPAHGASDALTRAQMSEILTGRSMGKIVNAKLQGLQNYGLDLDRYSSVGDSLGARMALDMALQAGRLGIQSEVVVGFEPADMEKRTSLGIAASFFVKESFATRRYQKNKAYADLNKAYEVDFKTELTKYGFEADDYKMSDIYKTDPRIFLFNAVRSPLTSGNGMIVLEQLLEEQPTAVAIVSGGLSSICRWKKIGAQIHRLGMRYPEKLSWEVWPEDSHGMSLAPVQPVLTAFTQKVLKDHDASNC